MPTGSNPTHRNPLIAALQRRSLFLVAPAILAISTLFWWWLHPTSGTVALQVISAQLTREGITLALLALAASIVLASGNVDLSQAGVLAFCGTVFATLTHSPFLPVSAAIGIALVIGVLCGGLLGLGVSRQIDPLILTWAVGSILVLASVAYGGSHRAIGNEGGIRLGFTRDDSGWQFAGSAFWWAIGTLALVLFVLHLSNLPRHCRAIGANTESARFAGINVTATTIKAYSVSGGLVAAASIFACFRQGNAQTIRAESVELISIAIAVLGGTSMKGGQLSIVSVVCAAALWVSVRQQIVPLSFSAFSTGQQQRIAQGLFSILLLIFLFCARLVWRERTRVIRVTD